ncbi:MAG TPA: GFA family protein [Rhodothermales bacterium]
MQADRPVRSEGDMSELKGSCLCGAIAFEVTGPVRGVGSCHCSKCRKVSGTGGNAQFIVRAEKFRWLRGLDRIVTFKLPDGWGASRCNACGSPLPDSHDGGKRIWVPAGLMDDPLNTQIVQHIFCGSRADWDEEAEDARYYDEYPTS